jgi:pyridoxal phosphate enzyme (YggS family)
MITERLNEIEEKIAKACSRSGRKRDEIRLMGVSKFHSRDSVIDAWNAGLRLFGENRVREGEEKFAGFKQKYPGTEIHMIGSLQRNKAKDAAVLFDCVESVDRESLIPALDKAARERPEPLPVLLELHTGEESKSGFPDEDSLFRAVETIKACPALLPAGLMTMAPFTADEKAIRASFRMLTRARRQLALRFPDNDWSCLSMGMSSDFEIAIEEGSTLVRIGTAIFGERK